ncbi:peptidoglycan DD-metalloendopeptidase family protein [Halothiobacillus sp.]|uniref:murein hydrolase activator EnvC family protein n=1 Tax=Halothiobacillus sp. TaxID=1891311 RepID=UPI00262E03CE|nr:peptidoglycan DD-metalloendopeptidase family protein [Halothiobacillus sp.]
MFLSLVCTPYLNAYADNPGQLKQAIDQQKSALNKTRAAQEEIKSQLKATQAQLDQTEKAQNDIEERIEAIEAQRSDLEKQTTQLADEIKHLKAQIDDSLSTAYLLGNQAPISTLLSHDDALSSERYLYYIKTLVGQSIVQLNTLKHTEQAQEENKKALEKTQTELNQAEMQLAATLEAHRAQLATQNQLLLTLSQRADTQSRRLAELLAQKKELDNRIAALNAQAAKDRAEQDRRRVEAHQRKSAPPADDTDERSSQSTASGEVIHGGIPITGRIVRTYGAPIAEGEMRSQGILFSAPLGTPVRSVASGEVVYADSMKGWGNLVILRHANGYLSLYAHNSELKVQTGMRVKQGTVLSLSGHVYGQETGMYFEVRKGNDTINPLRWAPYRSLER